MTREEAWALLTEHVSSPNLLNHMVAVEAAMRAYAKRFGEDEDTWGLVGLLHDLDYERHPSRDAGHPFVGAQILRDRGVDERLCRAILSHADYTGVPRETLLEKTLFAVDELVGFVVAVALIRPTRSLWDVTADAVLKKMKDKAFARGVSRTDIIRGAEELGVPLEDHVKFVIAALQQVAHELGLNGIAPRGG